MTDLNDLLDPECVPCFVSKNIAFHLIVIQYIQAVKKLLVAMYNWKHENTFYIQCSISLITSCHGTWSLFLFTPLIKLLLWKRVVLCIISRECLLPVFTMSFLSVLQQGSAHTDDAASLNNSHGGLPSASSTSSTELNHQVEAFRGLTSVLAGQVPATLELKVEKPDKDEMHDSLSTEEKSDDESDKNMRTPRTSTRTRYEHVDTQF